jgi:mRNA-degrading endonuclease YafQ of YafQ-DinJ toxin-antitoxin module
MPNFILVWTDTFSRTARKFLRRHPDLTGLFDNILRQLEENPHAPRLRVHPLKGRHKNKQAISLTYAYRVVLIIVLTDHEITLLDIGSHDEV